MVNREEIGKIYLVYPMQENVSIRFSLGVQAGQKLTVRHPHFLDHIGDSSQDRFLTFTLGQLGSVGPVFTKQHTSRGRRKLM